MAHKKRSQRSRSIPYERCVDAGRPHAVNSAKYADTPDTATPSASTSRYGSNRSPVATSAPQHGTTSDVSSRGPSPSVITNRDHNHA